MISESTGELTQAERRFRLWMGISAWVYAFGAFFFLFAGKHIPTVINAISAKVLPFLPLYPLPGPQPEGAFWRVLGVSMMAMLTWICFAVYRDVRGRSHLVPILLLSKSCSTTVYALMFVTHVHLAYLVGVFTDGPIFLLTYALWFQAKAEDKYLDRKEEAILVTLGDALMPRGGAFSLGYLDLESGALADARRMFAAQNTVTLILTRLTLHALNVAPIFVDCRTCTFLKMPPTERGAFLLKLESQRSALVRALYLMLKLYVMMPFFNQPAAAQAVGYIPEPKP